MTLGPDSSTVPAPTRQDAGFAPSDQVPRTDARAAVGPDSKSLSDESPAEDSDAVQEVDFKEGGYGWSVFSFHVPTLLVFQIRFFSY